MRFRSGTVNLCLAVGLGTLVGGLAVQGCGDDSAIENVDAAMEAGVEDASGPLCGNSLVESGEECDDGNRFSGDGCDEYCQFEAECGNGVIEGGEECDATDLQTNCVWEGHLGGTTLCTAGCTVDASCVDPPDGDAAFLEAWFKLDAAAALITDWSGQGNSCLNAGSSVEGGYPGMINESSLFEQVNTAFGDCGSADATTLSDYTEMTIEVWLKMNTYAPPGSQMRVIISRNLSTDDQDLAYVLAVAGSPFVPNDNRVMFATHSMNDIVFSAGSLMTGRWYHVAAVYTPGELSLYIDGVFSASVTQSATGPIRAVAGSHTYLGGLYDSGQADPQEIYDGFLDDVKIWSVARTGEQICTDAGGFYDAAADPVCRFPDSN